MESSPLQTCACAYIFVYPNLQCSLELFTMDCTSLHFTHSHTCTAYADTKYELPKFHTLINDGRTPKPLKKTRKKLYNREFNTSNFEYTFSFTPRHVCYIIISSPESSYTAHGCRRFAASASSQRSTNSPYTVHSPLHA